MISLKNEWEKAGKMKSQQKQYQEKLESLLSYGKCFLFGKKLKGVIKRL